MSMVTATINSSSILSLIYKDLQVWGSIGIIETFDLCFMQAKVVDFKDTLLSVMFSFSTPRSLVDLIGPIICGGKMRSYKSQL